MLDGKVIPPMQGISFVLPMYNEAGVVTKCIASIRAQMTSEKIQYEIIVVDNGSTDESISVVENLGVNTFVCTIKNSPAATRNLGASKALYEYLCFVDADCLVSEGWGARVLRALSDPNIGAYGGSVLSPEEGNWVERTWAPVAVRDYSSDTAALAGANFSVRRQLFEETDGFDETLISAEDDEYSRRLRELGFAVRLDSQHAVVHLGYPKTLKGIISKQRWHGSSQLQAHGIHDNLVRMTILWLFALVGVAVGGFFSSQVVIFFIFFTLFAPAILALRRIGKFKKKDVGTYIRMYVISTAVLIGRSIGLIDEVCGIVTKKV